MPKGLGIESCYHVKRPRQISPFFLARTIRLCLVRIDLPNSYPSLDENVSQCQDTIRDPTIAPSQVSSEQFVLLLQVMDPLYLLPPFPSGIQFKLIMLHA